MDASGRRHGFEGSWDWLEYAAGLPSKPVPFSFVVGNFLAEGGRAILTGGVFVNSATTAGTVLVHDGTDTSGAVVAAVSVAASGLAQLPLPVRGVLLEIGCYVEVNTLQIKGSVYLTPLWHYPLTAPAT